MDKGSWICIFDKLFKELPDINIVVEDLGDLRDEVLELRDYYDFKGMRTVQFLLIQKEWMKIEKT